MNPILFYTHNNQGICLQENSCPVISGLLVMGCTVNFGSLALSSLKHNSSDGFSQMQSKSIDIRGKQTNKKKHSAACQQSHVWFRVLPVVDN